MSITWAALDAGNEARTKAAETTAAAALLSFLQGVFMTILLLLADETARDLVLFQDGTCAPSKGGLKA
jgi:hypothetical protein